MLKTLSKVIGLSIVTTVIIFIFIAVVTFSFMKEHQQERMVNYVEQIVALELITI